MLGELSVARRKRFLGVQLAVLLGFCCPLFLTHESWAASDIHDRAEYAVRAWTTEDGLPESRIQAIAQTPDGYLWVGTTAGLVRFDGARFVTYHRFNTPAFQEDSILSLQSSKDGSLWIGSEGGGLLHYAARSFTALGLEHGLSDPFVRAIYEDSRGIIWVGTNKGLFRVEGERLVRIDGDPPARDIWVRSIYEDEQQRIWAAGSDLVRVENDHLVSLPIVGPTPESSIRSLLKPEDATTPLLQTWYGLKSLHDDHLSDVPGVALPSPTHMRASLRDSSGAIWLGTSNGLIAVRKEKQYIYTTADGLPDDAILALYEDSQGNIWVGTIGGLVRLSRNLVKTVSTATGLDDNEVMTVSEDLGGHRWLVTGTGGIFNISPDGHVIRFEAPPLPKRFLPRLVFEDSNGSHWIGSVASGVARLDGADVEIFPIDIGHPVRAIVEDHDGHVWVGTEGGLSRWDGVHFESYYSDPGVAYLSVRTLLVDRGGDLWVGTDRGVTRIRNGKVLDDPVLGEIAPRRVYSILEDSNGTIWFGTRGGGLCNLHGADLACLSTREGLPSNSIFQLLQDAHDRYWMSGPIGIFSVAGENLRAVADGRANSISTAAYGSKEGVGSMRMRGGIQAAAGVFSDGKLWFASAKGAVRVDPEQAPLGDLSTILIEEVLVDQQPIDQDEGIHVPAGRQRLTIRYTAPNVTSSERIGFRYILEGFDSTWSPISDSRVAQYTGLAPGKYRFRVAAVDTYFPGTSAEISAPVVWHAPFYRTAWFFALCLVGLSLCSWAGVEAYHRRTHRTYAIRLAERTRVAREMHDTVIQGCMGLSALLEATSSAMVSGGSSACDLLDHARYQLRSTVDEARHAVWDLRHEAKDEAAAHSLADFASHVSQETRVPIDLNFSESARDLHGELGRNVLLIGQEAIRNAVAHGRPGRVMVHLDVDKENAFLQVKDDGCGFNPHEINWESGMHYGLLGMKERVEQLGGRFEIISSVGKGTTILAQFALLWNQSAFDEGAS